MSVYVDQLQTYNNLPPQMAQYGRQWCHCIADTVEELHLFVNQQLRLPQKYFQPKSFPHYDLNKSKREQAVKLGVVELNTTQMGEKVWSLRRGGLL